MTDRERWIVYPLLFFSLALGLRATNTWHFRCREIECQNLQVQKINNEAYVPLNGAVFLNPSLLTVPSGPAATNSAPNVPATVAPPTGGPAGTPAEPNAMTPDGATDKPSSS